LSDTVPFRTREHILPESLGGGDWAILPDGYFCDNCQNRFGSSIEQQALNDYPFNLFRTFIGVPTKRKKAPWFKCWEGTLTATGTPGSLNYEPAEIFSEAYERGQKTVMRIVAYPRRPDMICCTLLKMGLEMVAFHEQGKAFEGRYDEARTYALTGTKSQGWWYLQEEDDELASKFFAGTATEQEWTEGASLSVEEIDGGRDVFRLQLLYLTLIVPLDADISPPPMLELPEPRYRLFTL
jgi:hypothetical protein